MRERERERERERGERLEVSDAGAMPEMRRANTMFSLYLKEEEEEPKSMKHKISSLSLSFSLFLASLSLPVGLSRRACVFSVERAVMTLAM